MTEDKKHPIENALDKTNENFDTSLNEVQDEFFKKKTGKKAMILIGSTALLAASFMFGSIMNSDNSKVIVKGNDFKITQTDLANVAKNNAQQPISNVFVASLENKMLSQDYSKAASKDKIDEAYKAYKEQYGDQFKGMLESQGTSDEAFRDQIATQLMLKAAIEDHAKKNYMSDKDIEKAWKEYTPATNINIETYDNKAEAEKAVANANENLSGFKSTSIEKEFDSAYALISPVLKAETAKMKVGENKVIADGEQFYAVHINSRAEKAKDVDKKKAKDIILEEKQADEKVLKELLNKLMKDQNIKLSDDSWEAVYKTFTDQLK